MMQRPFSHRMMKGRRAFRAARARSVPMRLLIPNMVTVLGMCVGLTSIRMAIEGRFELALAAICGAAVLDGLDGRMARLLKASSRFGAELDSLSDFVCFGVAPAIVLYLWGFSGASSLGWIMVLMFALAAALRLARFNVALDAPAKPLWDDGVLCRRAGAGRRDIADAAALSGGAGDAEILDDPAAAQRLCIRHLGADGQPRTHLFGQAHRAANCTGFHRPGDRHGRGARRDPCHIPLYEPDAWHVLPISP